MAACYDNDFDDVAASRVLLSIVLIRMSPLRKKTAHPFMLEFNLCLRLISPERARFTVEIRIRG